MPSEFLPDLGALIYISLKPLIKFALPVSFGFILTSRNLFPLAASRGAGQLILNILIPSLLFSKVVQSFDTSNASALGPIILVGAFYELFGLAGALLVRLCFPVPTNFRNGLLVAGLLGNWGDLPFAILQTVTASKPFDPSRDPALAQAYVCVFMVIYLITAFPLGGITMLARDYTEPYNGQMTDPPIGRFFSRLILRNAPAARSTRQGEPAGNEAPVANIEDAEKVDQDDDAKPEGNGDSEAVKPSMPPLSLQPTNRTTRSTSVSFAEAGNAGAAPFSLLGRNQTITEAQEEPTRPNTRPGSLYNFVHDIPANLHISRFRLKPKTALKGLQRILAESGRQFVTPPTIALVISLVVALVRPLKALFVHIPEYDFHLAPDGQPVLDIFFQTATFLGNAAVPVSCILLGAALARIKVPRPITKLPLRAMFALAGVRMVLMPIAGVALVQALTFHSGIMPPENHVLRYSLLVISCVPAATQQIVLSEVVCPPDQKSNSDIFGCFLLAQYAVLVFASTITATYSLSLSPHLPIQAAVLPILTYLLLTYSILTTPSVGQ